MHSILAHHNPHDPNFRAHVLMFNGNAFCIGCSASKLFMVAILPLLAFFTMNIQEFGSVETIFVVGLVVSALIMAKEYLQGLPANSIYIRATPQVMQGLAVVYVALTPTIINLEIRLGLATLLALPQISIYVHKIVSGIEFTNTTHKFIARLSMIIGFYFALIGSISTPIISLSYIVISAILFLKLRRFSSYRVGNDKLAIINPGLGLTNVFKKMGWASPNGILQPLHYVIILGLFLIGLVSIISTNEATVCNNTMQAASISVPLLALSSKPNFCPSCGDPVDINEKFCDKCGFQLTSTPSQPQYSPPPSQQNYGGGGYYETAAPRRSTESSQGVAIVAAIIVFFLGLLISQNLFIAILVGALAYGGVMLAGSTDNCCAQYLIMDCCCECICGILGSSANSKR